jgi:hypothetical protein
MKHVVFWDVALCRSWVNRRFGGWYRLHLQSRKIRERGTSVSRWLQTAIPAHAGSSLADFSTLKKEAILSSETSVGTRSTQHHIPEDCILDSRLCENLKSWCPCLMPRFKASLANIREISISYGCQCSNCCLDCSTTFRRNILSPLHPENEGCMLPRTTITYLTSW